MESAPAKTKPQPPWTRGWTATAEHFQHCRPAAPVDAGMDPDDRSQLLAHGAAPVDAGMDRSLRTMYVSKLSSPVDAGMDPMS